MKAIRLQILAQTPQERGDVFTDLVGDAFIARGYTSAVRRATRSGSEIDLFASDHIERRRALAECKATKEKAGTPEVNKFIGVMEPHDRAVVGYFVSLNGFTAQALEQHRDREERGRAAQAEARIERLEAEKRAQKQAKSSFERREPKSRARGPAQLHLLDGSEVAELAINAHLAVPVDEATEEAGKWKEGAARRDAPRLLGHRAGWDWLCVFESGYVVVGGDGHALDTDAAAALADKDPDLRHELRGRRALGPPPTVASGEVLTKLVEAAVEEAGVVTFEGLPADAGLTASAPRLEGLFVPVHLHRDTGKDPDEDTERLSIGLVLARDRVVAMLGHPGAGKSTLLRSLTLHYGNAWLNSEGGDAAAADPVPFTERLGLPERDWLPLVIRCRELGAEADRPIQDILAEQGREFGATQIVEFGNHAIRPRLRDGRILVLVDGLDEIADVQARTRFVRQLRRFASRYRFAHIVVTARHTGFEAVAPLLAGSAVRYRVAELSEASVVEFARRWGERIDRGAELRNADTTALLKHPRLRKLARNPLLLTTLLLVRRWLGRLPQNRVALYDKAIEVLLMTWNVEAWEPISMDEALPQLGYVAAKMTENGQSTIDKPQLLKWLDAARAEVPEVFAYSGESVSSFLERVELRSSVLLRIGVTYLNGRLESVYEFRHLTFQEYLTAHDLVERHRRQRPESDLVASLSPFIDSGSWREVIPLAAVRAGAQAHELLDFLVGSITEKELSYSVRAHRLDLLLACLADDVLVAPEWLPRCVSALVSAKTWSWSADRDVARQLVTTRFGNALVDETAALLLRTSQALEPIAAMLVVLLGAQQTAWAPDDRLPFDVIRGADGLLTATDEKDRMRGALLLTAATATDPALGRGGFLNAHRLIDDISSSEPTVAFAAGRALLSVARSGGLSGQAARRLTRITREMLEGRVHPQLGVTLNSLRHAAGRHTTLYPTPEPYLGLKIP